jgi:hypothetical protein
MWESECERRLRSKSRILFSAMRSRLRPSGALRCGLSSPRRRGEKDSARSAGEKPRLKRFFKLNRLRKETAGITRIIEDESEQIEPEQEQGSSLPTGCRRARTTTGT